MRIWREGARHHPYQLGRNDDLINETVHFSLFLFSNIQYGEPSPPKFQAVPRESNQITQTILIITDRSNNTDTPDMTITHYDFHPLSEVGRSVQ